jgi:hypothetical protein
MSDSISLYHAFNHAMQARMAAPIYKIVGELRIQVDFTFKDGVNIPNNAILAQASIIHLGGLEGEYEWFAVKGKDLKKSGKNKLIAAKKETLTDPLRLDGLMQFAVATESFDFAFGIDSVKLTPSFRLLYVDKNGAEVVKIDASYPAAPQGSRTIQDVYQLL